MKTFPPWLLALVLCVACAGVYWNAADADFVWDDINLIVMDYQIRDFSFLQDVFTRDFFGFQDNARKYGYFRPVITITFMIDYAIWGLNASGFHISNIVFHTLATVLLFFVFLRLAPSRPLGPFLAAFLFAVHPIHTESVSWIAGRTDTVCGLFFFGSMLSFMIFAESHAARRMADGQFSGGAGSETQGRKNRWGLVLVISYFSFLVALLAKEMAVVLPGVLAVYLLFYFTGFRWKKILAFLPAMGGFLVILAGYGLYRYLVVDVSEQAKDPWGVVTTLLSFLGTIAYYLMKMAWPLHQSGYIQNELVHSVVEAKVLAAFVLLALIAWGIWAGYEKDRLLGFSLSFLIITFAPLSNFVRISGPRDMGFMTAERFLYIPSAPFLLVVGVLLSRLIGKLFGLRTDKRLGGRAHAAVAVALIVVMAGLYAHLTVRRNEVWKNNENFFKDCISKAPSAPLLYMVLGNIYSLMNRYDEAEKTLKTAIEYLSPRDREEPTWIYSDLAGVYAKQEQYDKALEMMKLAGRGRTRNSAVEFNLGEIYRMMGDLEKARDYYMRSLSIDSKSVKTLEQLGMVLQKLEDWEAANKRYIALEKLLPKSARTQINIGKNYMMLRQFPRAVRHLEKAIALHPRSSPAWELLGNCHLSMGESDVGIRHLKRALEQDPDNHGARASLGNALFTIGEKVQAHQVLLAALKASPNNIKALIGMGILASDQGHPEIAQKTFRKVLRLEPGNRQAMLSMGILLFNQEEKEKSEAWFVRVLAKDPGNEVAGSYLARLARLEP